MTLYYILMYIIAAVLCKKQQVQIPTKKKIAKKEIKTLSDLCIFHFT